MREPQSSPPIDSARERRLNAIQAVLGGLSIALMLFLGCLQFHQSVEHADRKQKEDLDRTTRKMVEDVKKAIADGRQDELGEATKRLFGIDTQSKKKAER